MSQNNDFEAGLYNIGLGSVIGGIGAVVNKEPGEKLGKVLLKGMGQGALGGYVIFESKRMVRLFANSGDYGYVWPSRLMSAAGSSIVENAAANRNFWEKWHLHIGFNRLEFTTTEEFRLSYRIMPLSLVGTVITATRGEFDFQKSLKTGTFVFTTNHIERHNSEEGTAYGQVPAFGNSILILDTWEGEFALAHEIIHTYQNESFSGINSYFDKPASKFYERSKSFRMYSKIFHTDFNTLLVGGLYNLEAQQKEGYEGNIFEKEAFYFTGREMRNPVPPVLF